MKLPAEIEERLRNYHKPFKPKPITDKEKTPWHDKAIEQGWKYEPILRVHRKLANNGSLYEIRRCGGLWVDFSGTPYISGCPVDWANFCVGFNGVGW